MRARKAKALRRIARNQCELGNVSLETTYDVATLTKFPIMTKDENGQPAIIIGEKPKSPTKLQNCHRRIYKQLKRLI